MPPKPKDKVYTPDQERLDRFDMFRASLTPEEQEWLDNKVKALQALLGGHRDFGPKMGREMLIALVDFYDKNALPAPRVIR